MSRRNRHRWQVYVAVGDAFGKTDWVTTRTMFGAFRVVRRLNASKYAREMGYVFAARRRARSRW